jgi:hypothetical protein
VAQENHTLTCTALSAKQKQGASQWGCWGVVHLIHLHTSERSPTW